MTTSNKNFKIKNGLEVLGTTATVDGENVLTRSQSDIDYLNTVVSGDIYTYGDTPPLNPNIGDRWVDSDTGFEYTWLDDGTSIQWVETRGSGYVGPANELTLGTVTTSLPGTNAEVQITGESPSQTINFTIPRGDKGETGDPNELTVGTVTTGAAGTSVDVTITGTAPNQTIDFTIPQGIQGEQGIQGLKGDKGDKGDTGAGFPTGGLTGMVLAKNSDLDYDTEWIVPASGGGGGTLTADDAKPLFPVHGSQWLDTTTGVTYAYVEDVDGGQWVEQASAANLSSAADIRLSNAESDINDLETAVATINSEIRPVALGGTGSNTAAGARINLDAAQTVHVHATSDITSGQFVHDRMPTGAILQVVQAVKTNTYSQNSNTFTDIPGYSVSITPKFSTSKILFMSQTNVAVANGYNVHLRMMRNSTPINVGDASGGRPQSSWQGFYNTNEELDTVTLQYLDSPATTSAITYKVQIKSGVECRVNYTIADRDNGSGTYDARVASTLTVMEIAG